jgi:hypothetical protein
MKVMQYLKAIFAAAITGLTALQVALNGLPANSTPASMSMVQWITISIATLTALSVVWGVSNSPAPPKPDVDNNPPAKVE